MKNNLLSKQQSKELKELILEMTDEAKRVVNDYKDNPSEMSGSIIEVHENSPLLSSEKIDKE